LNTPATRNVFIEAGSLKDALENPLGLSIRGAGTLGIHLRRPPRARIEIPLRNCPARHRIAPGKSNANQRALTMPIDEERRK
jgi:hypothetical protein